MIKKLIMIRNNTYKNLLVLIFTAFGLLLNAQEKGLIVSKVGEQEVFVNSKITVYFSTLNNTKQVTYFCPDIPSFGKVFSLEKGDGKIVFEPSQADIGEYTIELNATSELGKSRQYFKLIVKGIENGTRTIYVDPINGNDENSGNYTEPLKSLKKLIEGGDSLPAGTVIYLRSGNLGQLVFSDSNDGMVYIVAEKGQTPMAERLNFPYATNWSISGLKISPAAASTTNKGVYVKLSGGARNIIVQNCEIYGTPDISDWPTNQDWYDYAGDGITSQGKYCTFRNNYIYNTDFPVTFFGKNNTLAYNLINNFSGDAVRGLGDYGQFLYNQIKNAVVYDYYTGNHDDGFQSWINGVKGIVLKGNQITDISYPDLPLQTKIMQGVVDFDGFAVDWVIEDNLIVIHHNHGIALYGAKNCKIVNNTVIKNPFKKYQPGVEPWIRINRTKSGEFSYGNLTRNNIMGSNFQDDYPGTYDHNYISQGNTKIFIDYNKWNFHLKPNTVAIDRGEIKEATTIDADGVLRNIGLPDLGCFERGGKDYDFSSPVLSGDLNVDKTGASFVELSWADADDNFDIKDYHVVFESNEIVVKGNKCLVTDLYSNTNYTFKVYALDNANNRSNIIEVSTKTNSYDNENYLALCASVKEDQEITNGNKKEWVYGEEMKIGGVKSNRDLNGVFAFKIPSLPPNKSIVNASISVAYNGMNGTPSGNIDIYGLKYQRKPKIDIETFYQGDFGFDNNGFSIMDDFITPNSATGVIKTDSFASSRLLEYIKMQKDDGAHGGNYLFIRLNVDVKNELNSSYYKISSGDTKNSFDRPILTFTLDHNTSTNRIDANIIDIYPNPALNSINIKNIEDGTSYIITDLYGNIIANNKLIKGENTRTISLNGYLSGVYFIKIRKGEDFVVKKFVKI